jgi:hypothetical protein
MSDREPESMSPRERLREVGEILARGHLRVCAAKRNEIPLGEGLVGEASCRRSVDAPRARASEPVGQEER